jgi:hypothetical protein
MSSLTLNTITQVISSGASKDINGPSWFTCPICFNDILPSGKPTLVLPCQHLFCESCLGPVLKNDNESCPVCRGSIDDTEPIGVIPSLKRAWLAQKVDCEHACGAKSIEIGNLESHARVCPKLSYVDCGIQVVPPVYSLQVGRVFRRVFFLETNSILILGTSRRILPRI